MQTVSSNLKTALLDIDARVAPRTLVDLYELYDPSYIPGVNGFVPADAIETFAGLEITWNGIAYRREVMSRGDIVRNMGEKTNQCTITFSNISRYMATLAQSQTMEGLFLVIRTVVPSVTDDSLVLFVGRCDKPSDIDKKQFSISARQDFGNINQTLPPHKFVADDPEGRLPSDPLYEGIQFAAIGGSITFPEVVPSTSFFGRLFGRRQTIYHTEQWSSVDGTPYGEVIPEVFGRCQMQLIPFSYADKGSHVGYLMAACKGPIKAIENIKSRSEGLGDPVCNMNLDPPGIHLGDPGGTGTNTGNPCQSDLGGGQFFSHLAYIDGASLGSELDSIDDPPVITAIVVGRIVPVPNSSGVYSLEEWTDNPVHIARFILTTSNWVGINDGFMEDSINYLTAQHCDFPLLDETNDQLIAIHAADIPLTGTDITRFRSTGILSPRFFRYHEIGDLTDMPEIDDGPYEPWDPGDPPLPELPGATPTFIKQTLLRKRYTCNVPITGEVRAVDFLYKTIFPTAKLFLRVNKKGKYEIRSETASDATHIRSATAVGDTSIPVLNVTPWKSGPELLTGRILLGFGLTTSEVRTVSSADYSTSGNSVTLDASATGTITATRSGATLSGGSTTVQASGTVTIGGTPATGNTVTVTIDGIAVIHTLTVDDTTGSAAAMVAAYINANPRLSKYIKATWLVASPTVVTITCLHGALNVPALLKAHSGPIADPSAAPTVAAAASGALAAGAYSVAYSDVTAGGTSAITPVATVTLTVGQKINVSSLPAFPAGVIARYFYLSETTGSTNLRYIATRTDVVNFSINALPGNGAALPPSHNTTAEELIRVAMSFATNSQDVYPLWPVSTAVILNDIYLPTTPNGHKYQVSTAGTTGSSEPTWPTSPGGTVASGTAVFTEIGSTVLQQAGLTRANIKKDTYKYPLGSRQSSVNQVKGSFRDARNDFALTPVRVNDRTHQTQVAKIFPLEFDASAIDNRHQFDRIANFLLSKHREGDWFNTLGTGPAGLVLEEGDPICASDDSGGLINVVTRIEELVIHANHDVTIRQARKYSTLMFSDDVGAQQIPIASTLRFSETLNTVFLPLDLPYWRDSDPTHLPGFHGAIARDTGNGDWRGSTIYSDATGSYAALTNKLDVEVPIGVTTNALTATDDVYVIDTISTVRVQTTSRGGVDELSYQLQSTTEEKMLKGANKAAIGINGRWEIVQFQTVTPVTGDTFDLTVFTRGRHGTEANTSNHATADKFVLLTDHDGNDTGVQFIPINFDLLNTPINLKAVTTNQNVSDATAQAFTWTGQFLRPLATTDHKGTRDSAGSLLIEFNGRTRTGGGLRSYQAGAINEEAEEYRVQILNNGSTILPNGRERIIPVIVGMPQAALLESDGATKFTHVVANSLITPDPFAGSVNARGVQKIETTGNVVEAKLRVGTDSTISDGAISGFGIVPSTFSWRGATLADIKTAALIWIIHSVTFTPDVRWFGEVFEYGVSKTDFDLSAEDISRYRIALSGRETRVYRNWTGSSGELVFASSKEHTFPYVLLARCELEASVLNTMLTTTPFPKTIYAAREQEEDWGSVQDPIQMDVWQSSRIVGPGQKTRVEL